MATPALSINGICSPITCSVGLHTGANTGGKTAKNIHQHLQYFANE